MTPGHTCVGILGVCFGTGLWWGWGFGGRVSTEPQVAFSHTHCPTQGSALCLAPNPNPFPGPHPTLSPCPKQSLASNGSQEKVARTESFGSPPLPLAAPSQPHKQWCSALCPAPMSKPHLTLTLTLTLATPQVQKRHHQLWLLRKSAQDWEVLAALPFPWQPFHSSPSARDIHFVLHQTLNLFLTLTLP